MAMLFSCWILASKNGIDNGCDPGKPDVETERCSLRSKMRKYDASTPHRQSQSSQEPSTNRKPDAGGKAMFVAPSTGKPPTPSVPGKPPGPSASAGPLRARGGR